MSHDKVQIAFCIFLLLFSVGCAIVIFASNDGGELILLGSNNAGLIIELKCDLPKSIPHQIPSLAVFTKLIDYETATEIATARPFFVGTQVELRNYTWINGSTEIYIVPKGTTSIDGNTAFLRIFPEGQIQYYSQWWTGYIDAPTLPTKEEAKLIADDFLLQIQNSKIFIPSLPTEIVFKEVVPGMETTTNDSHWIDFWCVIYEIRYDGLPIGGNSDVRIWIGDKGEIVSFIADWRDLKPSDFVTISITPTEALNQLKNHLGTMSIITKLEVQNVTFGYWAEKTVIENTEYILPAYIFNCVATSIDGSQQQMYAYVPAYG